MRSTQLPWLSPKLPRWLRDVLLFAAVAAAYVVGYELAQNWFSAEDQGASFFPPAGVTLAALVLLPRSRWAVVLAAAALSEIVLDLANGTGLVPSMGYALANTVEPLVGAALVTALLFRVDLRRTRHFAAFVAFAVLLAPAVGGSIAATTFVLLDDHSGWARFAFEWWCGDGLAVLVVGSALLTVSYFADLRPRQWMEAVVLGIAAVAGTWALFGHGGFEYVYVPVAILIVIAFRVGTPAVAATGALVALVAAGGTAEANDFWGAVDVSPANRILYLQLALGLIVGSVLGLASEIAERERIALDLARTETERTAAVRQIGLARSEQAALARTEMLQALTAALSAAASVTDVSEAIVHHGAAMLDADAGAVAVPVEGGAAFEVVFTRGYPREIVEAWRRFSADVEGPMTHAAAERQAVYFPSVAAAAARYPRLAAYGASSTALDRASVAAPLFSTRNELLGVVYLAFHDERVFEQADRQMVDALARQGAVALERAAILEREQEARRRAELLERHVARQAVARTPGEVAEAVLAGLDEIGVEAAWVQRVGRGYLAIIGQVGLSAEAVEAYGRYSLQLDTPSAEAVRTGRIVEVGTSAELERRFPFVADGGRRLRAESVASVPLKAADGSIVGALTMTSTEQHWVNQRVRTLLTALAEQCGLALERAELEEAAHGAAAEAELMALLGEVLERRTTAAERASTLARALTAGTVVLAAVYLLDDSELQLVARAARDPDEAEADRGAAQALAAAVVVTRRSEQAHAHGLDLIATPLNARGRLIGVLVLGARPGSGARVTPILAQRIATRAALALDNALLYEQERNISHSLQLGLLGGEIDDVPGALIATAYQAATATLEVGGDWHDAFLLPDGRLALAVGDVVGHGLEAAVAMGQLRGAVRALAPVGPPREVLERLDDFVDTLAEAGMATLAYAELNLADGTIAYACAGHPPPLLVPADGRPRLLWEGRSVPLGSSIARDRVEAVDRLEAGDTIVLYTDGLVERRRGGISNGLEMLVEVAADAGERSPSELVGAILARVLDQEQQDDDVCVLALQFVAGSRFSYTLPAAPDELGPMRRSLAEWLDATGVGHAQRADMVLAASEAAANAAEHAYGFDRSGLVRVEARLRNGTVRITVRDEGSWREPYVSPDRGRGLTIIEAVTDNMSIVTDERGTVVEMTFPVTTRVPGS